MNVSAAHITAAAAAAAVVVILCKLILQMLTPV